MKTHRLFKWLSRMAMLSGIPALTMVFGCEHEKLYGPPVDVVYGPPSDYQVFGKVLDKESHQPVSDVLVQGENGDLLTTTNGNGEFEMWSTDCKDLVFSKDDYQSKDTTLCPAEERLVFMQKQTKE